MTTKKTNESYDVERAFFGIDGIETEGCTFNGEYAVCECGSVNANETVFSASYPLWHDRSVLLENCTLTEACRSPLWYSKNIVVNGGSVSGARALRECEKATIRDCEISSAEFGWSTDGVMLIRSNVKSEQTLRGAKNVYAQDSEIKGKFALQYVSGAHITNCKIDSVDALWHAENVLLESCVIVGERLGHYSKNLTFKRCTIVGKEPLCYCKGLKLIDCVLADAEGAFEKSEVKCNLLDDVKSIRNPYKGVIVVPAVGDIIRDDPKSKAAIMIDPDMKRKPEIGG
ncbi:MAG: DUF3737 family protein [Clostridiales bacterium]|nr:DUF3737 family protein [Clostridiales bacterium]